MQYALACSPPGQVKLMAPEFQYLDGINPLTHQLSHDPTPPPVISVSYASSGADVDSITLEAFDIEAKLLSLQVRTRPEISFSPLYSYTLSSPLWPLLATKAPALNSPIFSSYPRVERFPLYSITARCPLYTHVLSAFLSLPLSLRTYHVQLYPHNQRATV